MEQPENVATPAETVREFPLVHESTPGPPLVGVAGVMDRPTTDE